MEIALVLVLAELRVVLLCLPWVPTLVKGRVGPFVLGIFVPLIRAVGASLAGRG